MIAVILTTLSTIIASCLWYLGAFKTVTFTAKALGEFSALVKNGQAQYHKVGEAFGELSSFCKGLGWENAKKSMGVYYDDPETVKGDPK